MIEHVFPPEMMIERERQLILALLDCAGVCYDANFTQNRILGEPVQIIDGVAHPILQVIGKPKNCSWTEIVDYWAGKMPEDEVGAYVEFSDLERIKKCYESGERRLVHKFWTYDVLGNTMLAEQVMRLYEDNTTGDILGLIYVTNAGEIDALQKKETEISEQYREASHVAETLQKASVNLPGGYHRCGAGEGYPFLFVSKSFENIVGYTKKQLEEELDNKFINLIIPEDLYRFMSLEKFLMNGGSGDVTYRIRRRDGQVRWVQDSTMYINWDGEPCYQCTIADITDFVNEQEKFATEKAEFEQFAEKIPCGYHRCTTDNGFKLEFVSDSFLETAGYTRDELIGRAYIDLVAPEDRELFMSHEDELITKGRVELAYRLLRKDGERRWIKDSTVRITHGEKDSYQCILADITDFVNAQEEIAQKNIKLMKQNAMNEIMEENMPAGYHRCKAEEGCPFTYIGSHFTDIVGFTKEEIEKDFGNLYKNLIWDEDIDAISTFDEMLAMRGKGNVYDTSVYRVKHKDGGYRWVTDSTMFVDMGEESFFQATISDITRFIDELNDAKRRAEESSMAKSTFLFNASHDIRTPMNAISGFAHIIEQNANDAEVVKATVAKITKSSKTLMTLLNDVLELSRIERGKEQLNTERTNLEEHGKNLYEMFIGEMENAGLTFKIESHLDHKCVLCDPIKLDRIGMNFLSNAKKFTPRGGEVVLGAEEIASDEKTATYRFYTRDNGIGMSKEFQERAFGQFERERSSTESGVAGSGLGLSITKKIIDLMGGECDIKSEPGKGTEISAILKFDVVEDTCSPIADIITEKPDITGKRILLVEDNEFNREIARYILQDMHIEVEEAENGSVCLEKLMQAGTGYYDLILMDIQMPVMDGYAATAMIRQFDDKTLANIPIIAMTANAFEEDKKKCISIGMNGHIGKPVEPQKLMEEISKIFNV